MENLNQVPLDVETLATWTHEDPAGFWDKCVATAAPINARIDEGKFAVGDIANLAVDNCAGMTLTDFAVQTNLAYKTAAGYAKVSGFYPRGSWVRTAKHVSWSHCREAMKGGRNLETALTLLEAVEASPLSVDEFAKIASGKTGNRWTLSQGEVKLIEGAHDESGWHVVYGS